MSRTWCTGVDVLHQINSYTYSDIAFIEREICIKDVRDIMEKDILRIPTP